MFCINFEFLFLIISFFNKNEKYVTQLVAPIIDSVFGGIKAETFVRLREANAPTWARFTLLLMCPLPDFPLFSQEKLFLPIQAYLLH